MALQAHRTTLLPRKILSLDTLTFLRAASTATLAGTYPYNIPTSFTPPPYPYGPSVHYRRRDSGLYGALTIQHGNLVSEQNEHKSRRVWRPNVHNKKLWSNYLGRFVQVKVVTRVLRTIDKLGGLDEYLVGSDAPARIKELGVFGWGMRWRVMQTKGYKERVAKERRALGLPEKGWRAEEEERLRLLRREGMMVAEAYLESLKVAEAGSRAAVETVEDQDNVPSVNFMREDEVSAAEKEDADLAQHEDLERYAAKAQERDDTELEVESEFTLAEEEDPSEGHAQNETAHSAVRSMDPAIPEYSLPSPSEQMFAQLTTIAAQLRTTPDVLITRTRTMIDNRATQKVVAAERKAELAAEQAALVSEIDSLLASAAPEPILDFHTTHLAVARSENALERERKGKPALTREKIKLNVTGPPSNIPADKWVKLHLRAKNIREEEPRRQQLIAEQRARRIERTQYLKEHREEIIAESKRRRETLGSWRRFLYEMRWVRRSGLGERYRRYVRVNNIGLRSSMRRLSGVGKGLWSRFSRRTSKSEVDEGKVSKA